MILSFVSLNILYKIGVTFQSAIIQKISEGITVVVIVSWHVFLYRVTSNFYKSKGVRIIYASMLIFQVIMIVYVNSHEHTAIAELVLPATIAYISFLITFCVVFFILLKDVFLQKHNLTYSLLVATNIYFMIPIIFSYVFSLVAIHDPAMVHAVSDEVKTVLYNCAGYSWFVMAGLDYPGEKISETIQSIAILESISANLFIVFIIGRLMSK